MTADGEPSTSTDDSPIVSLAHVAAGVNAVPGSLHWGPHDLIAYGAGPSVFLYDQGHGRVRASLVLSNEETSGGGKETSGDGSSSGRVCCVRWKGPEATDAMGGSGSSSSSFKWAELTSGTSDGVVATWRVRLPVVDPKSESGSKKSSRPPSSSSSSCCDLLWEQTGLLRIGAGVTSLAWHEEEEEEEEEKEEGGKEGGKTASKKSTLVAVAGTEVAVFSRRASSSSSSPSSSSPWVPCQRLSIHPRLAHAAALSVLGSEEAKEKKKRLLLAVGTVDGATLLFLGASSSLSHSSAVFSPVPAAAARGHGDWVRGVAFTSKSCSSRRKEQQQAKKDGEGEGSETTTAAENNGASSSSSSFSSSSSLLMATASNDRTVRVWEVSSSSSSSSSGGGSARGEGNGDEGNLDDDADVTALATSASSPSTSKPSSSSASSVSVRLVATLTGHDDWVMSVDWKKGRKKMKGKEREQQQPQPPCLLSVSADRSARLWSPAEASAAESFDAGNGIEEEDGLWLCDAVVGDAGSAAALGFCGGCFSPDGDGLAAAGPAGAIHVWRREKEEEKEEEESDGGGGSLSLSPLTLSRPRSSRLPRRWAAQPSAGGHCSRVVDACWSGPDAACLLSVSEDQTARLCTWLASSEEKKEEEEKEQRLWAEVARPQTHGHDFSCVAAVLSKASTGSPAVYASGSEEKVIRVFEAPRAFSQTLVWARGDADSSPSSSSSSSSSSASAAVSAFGATLPALGLSNRAVHRESGSGRGRGVEGGGGENTADGEDEEEGEEESAIYPEGPDALPAAAPAPLSSRPVEAALAGGTLWPEDVKLYGHGAELSALAATAGKGQRLFGGPLFASAAAAKAARWASIRLWRKQEKDEDGGSLSSWVSAGIPRECHSLTVTRLSFREIEESQSPSSPSAPPLPLLLASASRDRSFAVHAVVEGDEGESLISLETLLHQKGAHSRALTDCAWAPSPFPLSSSAAAFLATSSRDGSVRVWSLTLPLTGSPAAGGAAAELLLELPRALAPASALAFAPRCGEGVPSPSLRSATLAVGLGDGGLQLWTVELRSALGAEGVPSPASPFRLLWSAPASQRHAAAVRRLRFAPEWARFGEEKQGEKSAPSSWLASVGDDGAVRVFRCRC